MAKGTDAEAIHRLLGEALASAAIRAIAAIACFRLPSATATHLPCRGQPRSCCALPANEHLAVVGTPCHGGACVEPHGALLRLPVVASPQSHQPAMTAKNLAMLTSKPYHHTTPSMTSCSPRRGDHELLPPHSCHVVSAPLEAQPVMPPLHHRSWSWPCRALQRIHNDNRGAPLHLVLKPLHDDADPKLRPSHRNVELRSLASQHHCTTSVAATSQPRLCLLLHQASALNPDVDGGYRSS